MYDLVGRPMSFSCLPVQYIKLRRHFLTHGVHVQRKCDFILGLSQILRRIRVDEEKSQNYNNTSTFTDFSVENSSSVCTGNNK
jgi:hypothetical protein